MKTSIYIISLISKCVSKISLLHAEKRDELQKLSETDEFKKSYYVIGGVMLNWGLVNEHYYVTDEIAQTLKSQFESGGLYEVDAEDGDK